MLVHGFPESWYSYPSNSHLPPPATGRSRWTCGGTGVPQTSSDRGLPGCCAISPLTTSPSSRLSVRRRSSSSATTGVRRSRGTRRCCAPTCSAPWPASPFPTHPRATPRPMDAFRAMGGEEEFYIEYFQEPGRAEAEIEADVGTGSSACTTWRQGTGWGGSTGRRLRRSRGVPACRIASGIDQMPVWLSDEDLDFYVGEFERTGFTLWPQPLWQHRSGLRRAERLPPPSHRGPGACSSAGHSTARRSGVGRRSIATR